MNKREPIYRIGECRYSITGIGVVWPVEKIHGKCGCGAVEMKSAVAFFVDRKAAEYFIAMHSEKLQRPL